MSEPAGFRNPEWDRFGEPIGTWGGASRWFNGEPEIKQEEMVPIRERWLCPTEDCDGEMEFNGSTWPMQPQGYHHTCTECGFTAALSGKRYPRMSHRARGPQDEEEWGGPQSRASEAAD